MATLHYEIVFRMTIHIQQYNWFLDLALHSWIKQRNQTGEPFTELNRALKIPIVRAADVALSLTLTVSGVELPFNKVASVIFCLNLENKTFCLFFICSSIDINQSSDIVQHSQNRPTGDRWLKL